MDLRKPVIAQLSQWQQDTYEDVETASDIKVFNSIGALVGLVQKGLLELNMVYVFLTSLLELSPEESTRAYQVYSHAYDIVISKEMNRNE